MTVSGYASDLTAHLGFWLRAVSNHVSHAFASKLAAKGVTVAEWALMRSLYGQQPMSPSRLSEEMGLTRGAITKLANRLIAKALVVRKASRDDGRSQTLALTHKGSQIVPELAALADLNDAEFFQHLSAGERMTLRQLLRRMVERHRMAQIPVD
jgi:MarR family transcriptional regulator, lower aerobic nicotinate degradation pathway regulator